MISRWSNPFLGQIEATLPRLLGSLSQNLISTSYGLMDRDYWSWKTSDFANASPQSVVAGISQLWKEQLWPYPSQQSRMAEIINALVHGVGSVTRSDGSLEEAAPREGSWCVTALIGFDLMAAHEYVHGLLPQRDRERILDVAEPLASYVMRSREDHAYIANHVATAAAFLDRWSSVTGSRRALSKSEVLLNGLSQSQDSEGWFPEYGGADPGYQTLTMYFLADCFSRKSNQNLTEMIERSLRFLSYFVHPDGSFGGTYGSRNTRFYYPSGIAELTTDFPTAEAIHRRMMTSVANKTVVGLDCMDMGNIGSMFNSYCRAATHVAKSSGEHRSEELPCRASSQNRIELPDAGIIIDSGPSHYTIVSTGKGGVVYHFQNEKLVRRSDGVATCLVDGTWATTQYLEPVGNLVKVGSNEVSIVKRLAVCNHRMPNVSNFLILRILSVTFFRSDRVRRWVKTRIIRSLNTPKISSTLTNVRKIRFGFNLMIDDRLTGCSEVQSILSERPFSPLHMASQGYWQIQDEI